jgi:predicted DNA-binding transcriptional regulator AlpA
MSKQKNSAAALLRSTATIVPQLMLRSDASAVEEDPVISGPDLQRLLDISATTLWRWWHDKSTEFPPPKRIRGRLYLS